MRTSIRKSAHNNTIKNAEQMANCYNKKKRVTTEEFVINQSVSIAIPLNERTSSDVRRYPAKVIEVCGGDRLKQYIVATQHSSLKTLSVVGIHRGMSGM